MVKFENGDFIEYNKETQTLTILAKTVNIIADIVNTGSLKNTDGITSDADITDKKSSMQKMRDIYNQHKHTGNLGSPTSTTDNLM